MGPPLFMTTDEGRSQLQSLVRRCVMPRNLGLGNEEIEKAQLAWKERRLSEPEAAA